MGPPSLPHETTAKMVSTEIGDERVLHVGRHRGARAVLGMIDAERQGRALAQPLAHRPLELEAQEVHRRSLVLVLALEVLVGHGEDALASLDPDPYAPLDALQT